MTPDELFADFEREFVNRRFVGGLLLAFIDFLDALGAPREGVRDLDALFEKYPRQTTYRKGPANTLSVLRESKRLSIRGFYNKAERHFRIDNRRYDYPSCAPHATQTRQDYRPWLSALLTFSPAELSALRERAATYVLSELPSHEFDPGSVPLEPPLFIRLLEDFDLTSKKGEKTGAVYQGIVFGFVRADNPHLQVESRRVRTGSKRVKMIGDIDAWEGTRLAISAEVKQYKVAAHQVAQFQVFADEVNQRGAIGLVVALDFDEEVRERFAELGLKSLSATDLARIVELWDPMKQRVAVASFVYYANNVESNATLASGSTISCVKHGAKQRPMKALSKNATRQRVRGSYK